MDGKEEKIEDLKTMVPNQPDTGLKVESHEGVVVVRFTEEVVLSGRKANLVSDHLTSLVEDPGHQRMVLDCANVRSITSNMLGALITVYRTAEAAGGRFVLCNLPPVIYDIMKVTKLNTVISIYDDERAALDSF